jgi:hypothetical protein
MEISFEEQLKFLKSVREEIKKEALEIAQELHQDMYRSAEINELSAALSKAQGEYPPIKYNRIAKYFQTEYADIYSAFSVILPILSKYQLCITQPTEHQKDGPIILHTELSHASGQWKESRIRVIPPNNDPLAFTSTLNNIKRSQFMSLLGLSVSDDPLDDNAEIQMADERQIFAKGTQTNTLYNPRERSTECITSEQLAMLEKELTHCPDYVEEIFRGAQIETLADLPKNKFEYTIKKIRLVKDYRAGRRPSAD